MVGRKSYISLLRRNLVGRALSSGKHYILYLNCFYVLDVLRNCLIMAVSIIDM